MYQPVDLQLEDTAVQPCDYKQLPSTQGMHATFYMSKQTLDTFACTHALHQH